MSQSASSGDMDMSQETMLAPASTHSMMGAVRHPRHCILTNSSVSAGQMLTPPPSASQSELTAQLDSFSMNSPTASDHCRSTTPVAANSHLAHGMPSPPLQSTPADQTGQQIAQTPEHHGLPKLAPPSPPMAQSHAQRSTSGTLLPAPATGVHRTPRQAANRRLTPLLTVNQGRPHTNNTLMSPSKSPCVYVKAVSLESSNASSTADAKVLNADKVADIKTDSQSDDVQDMKSDHSHGSRMTPPPDRRLDFSAFVRPLSPEREPFAIRRVFDLDELLRAVPTPSERPAPSGVFILPSPVSRSPLSARAGNNALSPSIASITSNASSNKWSSTFSPRTPRTPWSPSSPSHSRRHSRQLSQKDLPSPDRFLGPTGVPLPMAPHSALGYLPALAAVILSGHIHAGDCIDLPLPHPEAWVDTVSYVYGAQSSEPTEAVKKNMVHLGGQVN